MFLDAEHWFVVDRDRNPVPGDEAKIRTLATTYKDRGDNFADMARILRNLERNDSTLQGEWVGQFRDKLKDLPTDLENFSKGFGTVGGALDGWANDISGYQRRAYDGLQSAKEALRRINDSQGLVDGARADLRSATDDLSASRDTYRDHPDDDQAMKDYLRNVQAESAAATLLAGYQSQLDAAKDDLEAAKRTVTTVEQEYKDRGDAVARSIDGAAGMSPSVSLFQWVFYSDAWQIAVKVLEIASTLLAIASLLVGGWVIALITAAVAAALAINKLIEYALGDANWKEAAVEVFFAVVAWASGFKAIASGLKGLKGAQAFTKTGLTKNILNSKAVKGFKEVGAKGGMRNVASGIKNGSTWKGAKQFCKDVASSTWKNVKTSWCHTKIQWHQLKNGWIRGGASGTAEVAGRQFRNFLTNKAVTSDDFRNLTESFTQFRTKISQWHFNPNASGIDNIKDVVKMGWDASSRSHLWQHSVPYVLNTQDFFEDWAEKGTKDAVSGQAKDSVSGSVQDLLFRAIPGYDVYSNVMDENPGEIYDNIKAIKQIRE